MRLVFYTHSLVSDWNHGNAHFLRGVMRDLVARGHDALALEPADGWSRANLLAEQGPYAETSFHATFPELRSRSYDAAFDHAAALDGADVVVVHEWTDPDLVAHIGRLRREMGFLLFFHDTHHRAVSANGAIADLRLRDYDAILAFGESLRQRYLDHGWGRQVHTWHEAADDRLFRPMDVVKQGDLIWIGNWGDNERDAELDKYLIAPARALQLVGTVRGVRWPERVQARLAAAGLSYGGWIANVGVPPAFARHRVTVHVPRRPYVAALPGIPTIRPFEALACGIPLVSAPWDDVEGLFRRGTDHLLAHNGAEMKRHLRAVLADPDLAESLRREGLATIRSRHTCRHRVDELLGIIETLSPVRATRATEAAE